MVSMGSKKLIFGVENPDNRKITKSKSHHLMYMDLGDCVKCVFETRNIEGYILERLGHAETFFIFRPPNV